MKERLLDILVAVITLIAGIVLIIINHEEYGSIAVSTSLGYLVGALRDKPGGLDEAVSLGHAHVEYDYSEGDTNA